MRGTHLLSLAHDLANLRPSPLKLGEVPLNLSVGQGHTFARLGQKKQPLSQLLKMLYNIINLTVSKQV